MLFLAPIVFILSLYTAVIYSYLYLCFTTFPRIFEGQYIFSLGQSGLVYLGIGVGSILGVVLVGAISDRLTAALTKKSGGAPFPEYRLPTMIIGAFLVPAGLFWYGWTAENKAHWILPILGTAILGLGTICVFGAVSIYLVDAYTVHAASATAAATVFRSLFGALLPLVGNSMYDALGVGWGTSVLGFIAIGFIPMPFLLYAYGARIRESKLFQVEF
jgi:MFS family permease